MSFLAELKQRNVIRVAMAYLVVSWFVLQFLDLVLENIQAPVWIMQVVMAVLALGFPVALVMAWAFDVTSAGIKVAHSEDDDSRTSNRIFKTAIAVITVAIAGGIFWQLSGVLRAPESPEVTTTAPGEIAAIDSIAVLPFENFSANSSDAYFADGLADTLLNKLAQLETLKVIARNSSFQFRGSNVDVREIGNALEVASILEGSVQKDGEQIRVIAQLIDTSDGSHIWSQTFDDTQENIFELQDRIAQAIMLELQVAISDRERDRLFRNGTNNREAYDLVMRARTIPYDFATDGFDPDTHEVLRLVDRALELDPDYAMAWVVRADVFNDAVWFGVNAHRTEEYLAAGLEAAENAVEIDPELAEAHVMLGWRHWRVRDLVEAEARYSQALTINPNHTAALSGLGLIKLNTGDVAQGYEYLLRARELDPQEPSLYRQLYFALNGLDRLDEGVAMLLDGVQRHPEIDFFYSDLTSVYIDTYGRPDEAARWASRLVERQPQNPFAIRNMVKAWLAVGDIERAGLWGAHLQEHFANSGEAASYVALITALSGDPQGAYEELREFPETPNFMFDRTVSIAGVCLLSGDLDCVAQQANRIDELLAMIEARGSAYFLAERYANSATIMRAIAQTDLDADLRAQLDQLLAQTSTWPIANEGGSSYRFVGYHRALANALLGHDEQAVTELSRTLQFADNGYLDDDFLRLPPDVNPVLAGLQSTAGYTEWYRDFSGRREQVHANMIAMEATGDIVPATDSSL